MANGHDGARVGVGKKKKALADQLLEGNPGKRKLTVLKFPDAANLDGQPMPLPRRYLSAKQKDGSQTLAVEVYEKTRNWLNERGCSQLVPAQLIEQYAVSVSRWIQCEDCITEFGFLVKTSDDWKRNALSVCCHEPVLHETDQQHLVSDLSGGPGKLCDGI